MAIRQSKKIIGPSRGRGYERHARFGRSDLADLGSSVTEVVPMAEAYRLYMHPTIDLEALVFGSPCVKMQPGAVNLMQLSVKATWIAAVETLFWSPGGREIHPEKRAGFAQQLLEYYGTISRYLPFNSKVAT